MKDTPTTSDLVGLRERAKELSCLYAVDEALADHDASLEQIVGRILAAIPPGWQYSEITEVEIEVGALKEASPGFSRGGAEQRAEIRVAKRPVGHVRVRYREPRPPADDGPFLKEEGRLLGAIADRIGLFILQHDLREAHERWRKDAPATASESADWAVIMSFLRKTDQALLARLTRKMINALSWSGAEEADALLREFVAEGPLVAGEDNRPLPRQRRRDLSELAERTFTIAAQRYSQEELLGYIRTWMVEEKAGYLIDTLEKHKSSLPEITGALERFEASDLSEADLPPSLQRSLRVSLLRRFFSDDVKLVNACQGLVRVEDFLHIARHVICSGSSHGRLGGKGTGLFQAERILQQAAAEAGRKVGVAVPKTWYIASDTLLDFLRYNNLEDVYDRKYLDVGRIRQDYPQLVQLFKSSKFPPEIANGLARAIQDLPDHPLIVRSSSLLEDQMGASFAGKYKSLFLPNQGTRQERLAALEDAVAEVFASVFSPDPIEYRTERGLLDVHEEMAVMIQEVVGARVGRYFLPAFAGVGFSKSAYRWSPRLHPEDGLLRLVPGLGTRAVDRVGDDYPVLIAPGQPNLRVNVTPDEVLRYAPRHVDVIDLEQGGFRTIELSRLLKEAGDEYPLARKLVSIVDEDRIRAPHGLLEPRFDTQEVVVTAWGLAEDEAFVGQIRWMLETLSQGLGHPVDIEIASDGEQLYLLQCRALSGPHDAAPDPIPTDLPPDRVVFTAERSVCNGRVPELSHLVYVDPDAYAALPPQQMREVGRVVGRLNQALPRRRFALLGPGRWGSRGGLELGVPVTYSDINNTALLVEIARARGTYAPELSFGTHFFLDLVEADIRYLPLYPEDPGVVFDSALLVGAPSILAEVLPQHAHLDQVVRVIDLPRATDGRVLRVLMNGDLDQAVGVLTLPSEVPARVDWQPVRPTERPAQHAQWRASMAAALARHLDAAELGVRALYLVGSTKSQTAGPDSDIDLVVHVDGDPNRRARLQAWLHGWSEALAEVNYLRTGIRADGLLHTFFVTDEEVVAKSGVAARIDAIVDPALPLPLGDSA